MIIKNNLKEILAVSNISQSELAKKVEVTKPTMSNIVNGKQIPSLELAMKISLKLNTPMDDIFYFDMEEKEEYLTKTIIKLLDIHAMYDEGYIDKEALMLSFKDILKYSSKKYSIDELIERIKKCDEEISEPLLKWIMPIINKSKDDEQ